MRKLSYLHLSSKERYIPCRDKKEEKKSSLYHFFWKPASEKEAKASF
ncbi:hypothetical protein HYT51_00500 [Candidatus Woesearchaeota archaeon]|nr:hypothetical protein [Candidatus Woesearchaeota archaeon]